MATRISLRRMIISSTTHLLRPAIPVPRLFHAAATSDHDETCRSPGHLRNTFKTFPFEKHPTKKQGPPLHCHLQEDEAGLHVTGEQLHPCLVLVSGAHNDVTTEAEKRKYSASLVVKASMFNVGKIKALFKDGVLRVVIPKLKEGQSFHGTSCISIIGDGQLSKKGCTWHQRVNLLLIILPMDLLVYLMPQI